MSERAIMMCLFAAVRSSCRSLLILSQGKEKVHVGLARVELGVCVDPVLGASLLPSRCREANAGGRGHPGRDPGAHGCQ